MKYAALIFGLMFSSFASADTVGYDQFFSNDVFKGAVSCAVLGGDSYLNDPVTVYDKPFASAEVKTKKQAKNACAQGGGDCACYFMYFEKSASPVAGKAFYKGRLQDGSFAWLLGDTKGERTVESLATETIDGEITFREVTPPIYDSEKMAKTMTKEQLLKVPDDVMKKVPAKNTHQHVLATVKSIRSVGGKRLAHLELNFVTEDPNDQEWDAAAEHKKSEQRTRLRDAWIPVSDSAGRINFWLAQHSGC